MLCLVRQRIHALRKSMELFEDAHIFSGLDCSKLRILRNCSSSKVVDILVFTQLLFPMVLFVQKTIEVPQLLVDTMADVPFMLVVQCWLCRLRCTSRCVRFPGSEAHDARRHGRY